MIRTKALKIQYLLTGDITVSVVYSWPVLLPFGVVLCAGSELCGVVVGVLSSLAILLRKRACCVT